MKAVKTNDPAGTGWMLNHEVGAELIPFRSFTLPASITTPAGALTKITSIMELEASDTSIIRVIEDIYDALVELNVIPADKLSLAARNKLAFRKNRRG